MGELGRMIRSRPVEANTPDEDSPTLIVYTPRRSKVGLIVAVALFLISAGLLYLAYWGWQQHLEFI